MKTANVKIPDHGGEVLIEAYMASDEEPDTMDEITRIIAESLESAIHNLDAALMSARRCHVYNAHSVSREVQLPNGTVFFSLTAKLKKEGHKPFVRNTLNEAGDHAIESLEMWAHESRAVGKPAW